MARITLPREPAVVYGGLAPAQEIVNVERDAEDICGEKTKLRSSEADDADQHAIRAGNHPPLPQSPSNQHRGKNCEGTGKIVKPQKAIAALRQKIPRHACEHPVSRYQAMKNKRRGSRIKAACAPKMGDFPQTLSELHAPCQMALLNQGSAFTAIPVCRATNAQMSASSAMRRSSGRYPWLP